MSVDIDATLDLLLLIQQKLHIVQYLYSSLFQTAYCPVRKLISLRINWLQVRLSANRLESYVTRSGRVQ